MRRELECEGRVLLGTLPPEASERLTGFTGSWLEFAPDENAIVVRHVQPTGCPALAAVPCELISILDSLATDVRDAVPGGVLYVRDASGQLLRLQVEQGEIRIQWAHEDFVRCVPVPLESAIEEVDPLTARVRGSVSFVGPEQAVARLHDFVDRFEGLYPEGNLDASREGKIVRAVLHDVNVGPRELLAVLRAVAGPPEPLGAEHESTSFKPGSQDFDFRLRVSAGEAQAERPSLWKNG